MKVGRIWQDSKKARHRTKKTTIRRDGRRYRGSEKGSNSRSTGRIPNELIQPYSRRTLKMALAVISCFGKCASSLDK